jgi:thiamine-monophosphate kinase
VGGGVRDEDALVAALLGASAAPTAGVLVGDGDDAAVLEGGIVLSADMLVDGVHFRLGEADAREVGHRAAAANLSDLAAMAAEPVCLLLCLGLPDGFAEVDELAAGMAEHGVALVGGDVSRSGCLTLAVTAVGRAERPLRRSGGRPVDLLAVTGQLGAQAASGYRLRVTPRLAEGRALSGVATAAIDVSDGIATDVRRLAAASGTGATVELERLPRPAGVSPEQAATGGEDFELLVSLPPDADVPSWLTVVGELTAGSAVRLLDAGGRERDLRGYDHFAGRGGA